MSQVAEQEVVATSKPAKKNKVLKIILGIIGGIFALGAAGVITVVVAIVVAISSYANAVYTAATEGVATVFGFGMVSIQTDSMSPTLEPGDLVFISSVEDPKTLQVDDIITYWTVINGERVLNTHRIVGVYDAGDSYLFETKGDNNLAADALTAHESEIIGVYSFKIPGMGKVYDSLIEF